jgi:hypothetical protein
MPAGVLVGDRQHPQVPMGHGGIGDEILVKRGLARYGIDSRHPPDVPVAGGLRDLARVVTAPGDCWDSELHQPASHHSPQFRFSTKYAATSPKPMTAITVSGV